MYRCQSFLVVVALGLLFVGLSAYSGAAPIPPHPSPQIETIAPSRVPTATEIAETPTAVIAPTETKIPTVAPTVRSTETPEASRTPIAGRALTTGSDAIVFESGGSLYAQPMNEQGSGVGPATVLLAADLETIGLVSLTSVASPNGKYIFLHLERPNHCTDCEMNIAPLIFTPSTGEVSEINVSLPRLYWWHPNSVAFLFGDDDGNVGMYNVETKESHIITTAGEMPGVPARSIVRGMAVSPDWQQLVVSFDLPNADSNYQTWVVNMDGSYPRHIMDGVAALFSWSPDGKTILFNRIESIQPDGRNRRILARNIGGNSGFHLHWSPDGRYIAFNAQEELPNYPNLDQSVQPFYQFHKIHILDLETGVKRRLIEDELGGDVQPAWSPDGKRIAFLSNRSGYSELWVADMDGNNLEQLTFDRLPKRAHVTWLDLAR